MFNDMCLVTKPNAKTGKTFIYLRTIPISEDSSVESVADTTCIFLLSIFSHI